MRSSLLVEHWRMLVGAGLHLILLLAVSGAGVGALDRLYAGVPLTVLDRRFIDLQDRIDELEVVVLGSSHTWLGVDPQRLPGPAFNAGGPSQDLYYDTRVVDRFLLDAPRLHTVIWGLAPFSFGYDVAALPGGKRRLALYDRYFLRRGQSCDVRCLMERHLEMLRVRGDDPLGAFMRLWQDPGRSFRRKTPNGDGFVPHGVVAEKDDGKRRAHFHKLLFRQALAEETTTWVIEATNALQREGVRVIFVRPPYAPSYLANMSQTLIQSHDASLARLLRETGAEYHDMSDAVETGKGYFRNSDHLQGDGTRLFSEMLARLVNDER